MHVARRFLWVAGILLAACRAESPLAPEPVPPWLAGLIHDLGSQPVANPPASILRYDYKSRVVYYVPPRCCDIWSDLYDAGGTLICRPTGGLSGAGDGRCPDFVTERKNEHLVWRDPRPGGP